MNLSRNSRYGVWLMAAILIVCLAGDSMAAGPKWIGVFFVKGKIGLKWQSSEGATEYRVYRKIGGGDFESIHTTDKTQYFDTQLTPGEVHVYKIAGVDASGQEALGLEKAVTVAGGTVAAFKAPTWSGLRTDRKGILLNWDKVKSAIAYNIHRSMTPGGPYDIVGNSASHRYSDRDGLEQGGTYYYVVNAMNEEFEETDFSEERSIKYGLTAEEMDALDTTKIELVPITLTHLFSIEEAGNLGTLNQPFDVCLNSKGDIYITDTRRFRIDCFDPSGKHKFSFGERTPRDQRDDPPEGTFESPMPMFIDAQDQVWVGDNTNNDIQVFTAEGKFIRRIRVATGGEGREGFRPNGLAVLDDGRIVASDGGKHQLLILDQEGKILFKTAHGGEDASDEKALWFSFPGELAVHDGVISVIDQLGVRIQQFDLDGKFIRSFGSAGYGAGQFGRPKAISVADNGQLWVSDGMANTVQIFTPDGIVKSAITKFDNPDLQLTSPAGMAIRDGKLYLVTRLTNMVHVFKIN